MLAQVLTAKVAAVAAVALFTAGTAAAATGNLPDPLQRGVASTLSHVGVDLATPTDESTTTTTETPTSTTVADTSTTTSTSADTSTTTPTTAADNTTSTAAADSASDGAVGPDANGPAKHGLCTAYFAGNGHAKNPGAVAFRNLTEAATAAGMTVDAFCAPTGTTTTTTDLATTADGTTTTDDATTIDGHGNSGSTPGATAPGRMTSPTSAHGKP